MTEVSVDGQGSLGSFDEADLEAWLVSGASGRVIGDQVGAVLRAQFLCAAIGTSFGPDVERGMASEGVVATLALAALPSQDGEEHAAKRAALNAYASPRASTDLVAVMVRAALSHDQRRLAWATEPVASASRCEPVGSGSTRTPPRPADARPGDASRRVD